MRTKARAHLRAELIAVRSALTELRRDIVPPLISLRDAPTGLGAVDFAEPATARDDSPHDLPILSIVSGRRPVSRRSVQAIERALTALNTRQYMAPLNDQFGYVTGRCAAAVWYRAKVLHAYTPDALVGVCGGSVATRFSCAP